jgi:hypothetical protein
MLSWFKKTPEQWKTVALPGEIGTIEIPAEWETEEEACEQNKAGTLLFYSKETEDVTFRISVL